MRKKIIMEIKRKYVGGKKKKVLYALPWRG